MTTGQDTAPTTPRTFGERLRKVREHAGLSLNDVASETKISLRILHAIEGGGFDRLPERIFCRNFVRQIAKLAGSDDVELVVAFDEAWERHLLASGVHPTLQVVPEPPSVSIRWSFWLPIGIGAAILLIVGMFLIRGTTGPESLPPDPRRGLVVLPESDEAIPAPTDPPQVETPVHATSRDVVAIVVSVRADTECWIHLRDGEGQQEQRLLSGGAVLRLDLVGPIKLTVGNAGAVSLEVNGRRYDDLGRPGQVVHTEVTSSGVNLLSAGGGLDG